MEMRRTLVPIKVKELGDRVLEIAGSTEDVDRMDDVIKSKGWQLGPFKKNPVFMWGHNYNQPPIGKALKVWVDKETKRLMFNIEFADAETYEFADTIFKLYKGGFLHATSVGFIPLDWEGKDEDNPYPKWEGNVFTKQELLELSAVPVPANANALVTARDNGLITVKEFEAVTKPEETDDYIRIPVKGEEGKHKDHEIKTIDVDKGKGIKALYCVDDKVIITYLFDKDNDEKWTLASAQEWVDEHANKEVPEPREVTQEQIRDDLDYLDKSITAVGLSEETATDAVVVAVGMLARAWPYHQWDSITLGENLTGLDGPVVFERVTGNDIPAEIETEGEEQPDPEPDPAAVRRQRALDVGEVAGLVIAKLKGKRIY